MMYYTKKELRQTPSKGDGISSSVELKYRKEGAKFIVDTGCKLNLVYSTMATAVVYFHRFFMRHSLKEFPLYPTACSCLLLAGKVEETPKKSHSILTCAFNTLTEEQWSSFGVNPKREVLMIERVVFKTVMSELSIEHPYKYLIKYAKCLKGDDARRQRMVQMAWTFVNDSLFTTLSLQWEPEILAIAMIFLACKLSKFCVLDWKGHQPNQLYWWDVFVEDLTLDIVEDICHQLLDHYVQINNESPGNSLKEKFREELNNSPRLKSDQSICSSSDETLVYNHEVGSPIPTVVTRCSPASSAETQAQNTRIQGENKRGIHCLNQRQGSCESLNSASPGDVQVQRVKLQRLGQNQRETKVKGVLEIQMEPVGEKFLNVKLQNQAHVQNNSGSKIKAAGKHVPQIPMRVDVQNQNEALFEKPRHFETKNRKIMEVGRPDNGKLNGSRILGLQTQGHVQKNLQSDNQVTLVTAGDIKDAQSDDQTELAGTVCLQSENQVAMKVQDSDRTPLLDENPILESELQVFVQNEGDAELKNPAHSAKNEKIIKIQGSKAIQPSVSEQGGVLQQKHFQTLEGSQSENHNQEVHGSVQVQTQAQVQDETRAKDSQESPLDVDSTDSPQCPENLDYTQLQKKLLLQLHDKLRRASSKLQRQDDQSQHEIDLKFHSELQAEYQTQDEKGQEDQIHPGHEISCENQTNIKSPEVQAELHSPNSHSNENQLDDQSHYPTAQHTSQFELEPTSPQRSRVWSPIISLPDMSVPPPVIYSVVVPVIPQTSSTSTQFNRNYRSNNYSSSQAHSFRSFNNFSRGQRRFKPYQRDNQFYHRRNNNNNNYRKRNNYNNNNYDDNRGGNNNNNRSYSKSSDYSRNFSQLKPFFRRHSERR